MKKFLNLLFLFSIIAGGSCFKNESHKYDETSLNSWGSSYEYEQQEAYNIDNEQILYASNNTSSTLYNYFYRLRNNFGNNTEAEATCGYIAIGMVLNYYDTIVNGNIVESKFQVNTNYSSLKLNYSSVDSPGTYYIPHSNDLYPDMVNDSFEDVYGYFNYLRLFTDYGNYHQKSLHAYLTLLGTDSVVSNNTNLSATSFKDAIYTNKDILKETINKYFRNLPTIFNYTIQQKYYSNTDPYNRNVNAAVDVFDFIMSEIDQGRPVIVGFNNHARVAYDYVYTGMDYQLITHEGYLNKYSFSNAELKRNTIASETFRDARGYIAATSLVLDESTVDNPGYNYHSTLYGDDNSYNGLYINHFTHIYDYRYTNYSNNYHKTYCKCNLSELEMHDYRLDPFYQGSHCQCGEENPNYLGGGIILKEEMIEETE